MPPQLAAFIFWAFVIWLFRRDAKQFGPMRPALWVPFIWICINGTKALIYWMGAPVDADAGEAEGSFWDRNVYLFLICIGSVILMRRPIFWDRVMAQSRWVLVLYAYYLLSTIWADNPFVAFKRWFKDVGDLVMILLILSDEKPVEALRVLFVRFAYLLVPLSVLVIKWYPAIGRYTHRWTYQTFYSGMSSNKNGLGLLAMISTIFVLWQVVDLYRVRRKDRSLRAIWPEVTVILMCAWLLNLAQSQTATVCTVLWVVLFLGLRTSWVQRNLGTLRWFAAGAILFLVCFTVSPSLRGLLTSFLGRAANLSDRTLIWDEALKAVVNPIVGAGFNSFWDTRNAVPIFEEFHVTHSHNGFLEVFMNTGLIGLFLVFVMLFRTARNVTSYLTSDRALGYLFFALFWTIFFFNYTEIAFSRSNVLGLLLTLLAMTQPGVRVLASEENVTGDEEGLSADWDEGAGENRLEPA